VSNSKKLEARKKWKDIYASHAVISLMLSGTFAEMSPDVVFVASCEIMLLKGAGMSTELRDQFR
jgi:hypothetical protein